MDDVELAFISLLLLMVILAVGLSIVVLICARNFGDWFANMINRYCYGRR